MANNTKQDYEFLAKINAKGLLFDPQTKARYESLKQQFGNETPSIPQHTASSPRIIAASKKSMAKHESASSSTSQTPSKPAVAVSTPSSDLAPDTKSYNQPGYTTRASPYSAASLALARETHDQFTKDNRQTGRPTQPAVRRPAPAPAPKPSAPASLSAPKPLVPAPPSAPAPPVATAPLSATADAARPAAMLSFISRLSSPASPGKARDKHPSMNNISNGEVVKHNVEETLEMLLQRIVKLETTIEAYQAFGKTEMDIHAPFVLSVKYHIDHDGYSHGSVEKIQARASMRVNEFIERCLVKKEISTCSRARLCHNDAAMPHLSYIGDYDFAADAVLQLKVEK